MSCEKLFEALILLGMLPLVPLRCGEGILETINLILQRLDVELFSFPMRSLGLSIQLLASSQGGLLIWLRTSLLWLRSISCRESPFHIISHVQLMV
jgi:hypothetical protein